MATYVNLARVTIPQIQSLTVSIRAASKDLELEDIYLKLLKEPSTHEKAITRDLGRYGLSGSTLKLAHQPF